MVGQALEDLLASYAKPKVVELSPSFDGNRRYSVMETELDKTEDGSGYYLLGFAADVFIVNSDGIIVGIQEER